MRKLRLDLDHLQVDSFHTSDPHAPRRGTVFGAAVAPITSLTVDPVEPVDPDTSECSWYSSCPTQDLSCLTECDTCLVTKTCPTADIGCITMPTGCDTCMTGGRICCA